MFAQAEFSEDKIPIILAHEKWYFNTIAAYMKQYVPWFEPYGCTILLETEKRKGLRYIEKTQPDIKQYGRGYISSLPYRIVYKDKPDYYINMTGADGESGSLVTDDIGMIAIYGLLKPKIKFNFPCEEVFREINENMQQFRCDLESYIEIGVSPAGRNMHRSMLL
ncbi:MAG: hypothetical protein IJX90_08905 [Blautia sp.]|nr:hypothetical protein [Blautia sp.]